MKRILVALLLLLQSTAYADVTNQLNIEEVDGSPSTYPYKLLVSNSSLTDNGDGTATLITGAGSGGGGANNVLTSDIGAVPYYNTRSTISEDQTFLFNPTTNTLFISADTGQSGNDNAFAVRTVAGANVMNVSHDGSIFGNNLQLSNDLSVLDGGTGLSGGTSGGVPYYNTATSMASSLLFAANAVVVGGGSGTAPFTITADTTANHVLVSTATSPNFRQLLTQDVSGVQSVASGGTGITSGTANALPYFATAGRMGSLTADTTAGHVLVSTTTLPNFRQLLTQDIAGVEDVATGGTGMTSGTSGGVPYFITTGRMASSGLLTANGIMLGGGAGATPTTTTADTATTGHFLASTATSPAMRQILTSDIATTGIFGLNMGGTGQSSWTKGDLLVGSPNGVVRLQVGANGTVLSADSTQTNGVSWVTPSTGGGSGHKIFMNFPVQSAKLSSDNLVRIDAGLNGGVTPYTPWRLLFASSDSTKFTAGNNVALWQGRMDNNWSGGSLTARIDNIMLSSDSTSGVGKNISYGVSIWAITSGDAVSVTTESYDTENTKNQRAPSVLSRDETVVIPLTTIDSLAAGDWFVVKLRRIGNIASAITGDSAVIGFSISE